VTEPFGQNGMLAADPRTGEIRRFLTGPMGQEMHRRHHHARPEDDVRQLPASRRHRHARGCSPPATWARPLAGRPTAAVPRSATIVITREDGGIIGA
jgi:uncharacterized protein